MFHSPHKDYLIATFAILLTSNAATGAIDVADDLAVAGDARVGYYGYGYARGRRARAAMKISLCATRSVFRRTPGASDCPTRVLITGAWPES